MMEPILFCRHNEPYYCFANFSKHPIVVDGVKWPTTEHCKYFLIALRDGEWRIISEMTESYETALSWWSMSPEARIAQTIFG